MERVLVCLLAQTRTHQLAWSGFRRHVIDELNADLALAVTIDENYDYVNPYWQHAKYRWASHQPPDVGKMLDFAQQWLWQEDVPPPDWRSMLKIKGLWQGGIEHTDTRPGERVAAGGANNLLFSRWLLLHNLQQDGVLDKYDRFVVTRSDFVWLRPHPPMSILDRDYLWVPDGEHYGGINDRHLVVSREDAPAALGIVNDLLLRPEELFAEMKHQAEWNPEQFLKHHLDRKGLLPRVRFFPHIMYTGRRVRDPRSAWSKGRFDPSVGHIVKYPREAQQAKFYASLIKTRADWESGTWGAYDATRADELYRPALVERVWSALLPLREVVSALWRPGRIARFQRFLQRHRSDGNSIEYNRDGG